MEIYKELFTYLTDLFRKNKGIDTIIKDFNEALGNDISLFWKKVKPIFIRVNKDLTEKIEENPNDAVLQGGFLYQISKNAEDPEFSKEVDELIKKLNEANQRPNQGTTNIGFQAGNMTITGTEITGIRNNYGK